MLDHLMRHASAVGYLMLLPGYLAGLVEKVSHSRVVEVGVLDECVEQN